MNLLTLLRSLLSRLKPVVRALDLRGFWMTRAEAARWLDAIDPPSADDSHPTRGDLVKAARPEELLLWARANRDNTLRGRALCAIYLAAWRGCRTSHTLQATVSEDRDPWLDAPLTPEEIEVFGRAETEQGEPW